MSEEKKLATMICCVCGKEIDKNYARNTVGNYCKRCAFDRVLHIQIEKDYESGAMDENIIFDVEEALKNNQDAGAYVGDLLRIIQRLQSENAILKTELRKECEEHEEFTKKAKAEIARTNVALLEAKNNMLKYGTACVKKGYEKAQEQIEQLTKENANVISMNDALYREKKELQKNVDDWVRVHDEQLSAMQVLTIENKNLQKQVDELTEKLGKVLLCVKADEVLIAKGVEQAVKDTAKEILQYVGDLYDEGDQRFQLKDYQWHKNLCKKYGVEVE